MRQLASLLLIVFAFFWVFFLVLVGGLCFLRWACRFSTEGELIAAEPAEPIDAVVIRHLKGRQS